MTNKKLVYRLCLFVVGLFSLVRQAGAQNGLQIVADDVIPQLPDIIEFQLQAESEADIESVALQYGTDGLSCQSGGSRQPMDFDPDTTVDLNWEWELKRSGAIPPGVTMWWQWEIEDADGNIITTERQELILDDANHEWRSRQRDGVTVYWYQGDTAFAEAILEEAIRSLDRLTNEIGVTPPGDIELWVYPTADAVQDAIVNVPEWTGGVAFSEYGVTVIGVSPGQLDWAARIIPHELTHLVMGIRTFNCRGGRLPTWLEEGLARYAEGEVDPDEWAAVEEALMDGRLPPLSSLASGFSAYSDAAGLAYTQSRQIVEFLLASFGPEQMEALLSTIQEGKRIDTALLEVHGFDTDELDARWRTSVGYVPTPTSEAEAAALQATPTLIPTLALGGIPTSQATAVSTATTVPATATPQIEEKDTPTAVPSPSFTPAPTVETMAVPPPMVAESQFPWLAWVGGGASLGLILVFVYFVSPKRK